MDHIDTVCTVDRKTSSSGHKSHDLIPRHRITASGEPYRHIINSLDHNTALGFCDMDTVLCSLCHPFQHHFVRKLLLMLLVVLFHQTVYHLALFQSSVTNGGKHCIPVPESILLLDHLHISGVHDITGINAF